MVTKAQEEMLQPVNGYQLAEVKQEVSLLKATIIDLETSTKENFKSISLQLEVGFKDIATKKYVDDSIVKIKKDIFEEADLKYGKPLSGIDKAKWIVISGLFAIVLQILYFCLISAMDKV